MNSSTQHLASTSHVLKFKLRSIICAVAAGMVVIAGLVLTFGTLKHDIAVYGGVTQSESANVFVSSPTSSVLNRPAAQPRTVRKLLKAWHSAEGELRQQERRQQAFIESSHDNGSSGDDVTSAITIQRLLRNDPDPKAIHVVVPTYPITAIHAHTSGEAVIQVRIDATGAVTSVESVSGAPLLAGRSGFAARRWRFDVSPYPQGVRTARLTFVYRLVPHGTSQDDLQTIFTAPNRVEIVARLFDESPLPQTAIR